MKKKLLVLILAILCSRSFSSCDGTYKPKNNDDTIDSGVDMSLPGVYNYVFQVSPTHQAFSIDPVYKGEVVFNDYLEATYINSASKKVILTEKSRINNRIVFHINAPGVSLHNYYMMLEMRIEHNNKIFVRSTNASDCYSRSLAEMENRRYIPGIAVTHFVRDVSYDLPKN